MNEHSIFLAALEIADLQQRAVYLDQVCADDPSLRGQVESLLGAHDRSGDFLNVPALKQMVGADSGGGDPSAETSAEPAAVPKEIDLSFLKPSDKPGSLGRLSHYEVEAIIGRGGCGVVLKAFDEKLERTVAVKIMAPELAVTSPARKRFLREARASAKIRHENVVSIYAVDDDPLPYLVMEYIPGQTLQQRLDQHGPLDLPNVLRLGKQIADGLAAAHEQQLIHRDIKPGNVLLETGREKGVGTLLPERPAGYCAQKGPDPFFPPVKITDFGLARAADDASMTQSGVIAGTPMYMAPEQALGQKLDQRTDLFSLGSVLYQTISGRPPFRASNTMAVLKRVTEDAPRPITEIIPETPDWLCQLVANLHQKDPDDRYGSAKEVADLLGKCLTDLEQGRVPEIPDTKRPPKPESTAAPEPSSPGQRRRRRPLLKVAAAILLLLVPLGLTEAIGVTQLTPTVIRLWTGSGTLVIESNDPSVKITIDGAGEKVTIRGGGVQELTLRPGKYKVYGKGLKKELVTITRNGRTAVRISMEPNPSLPNPVAKRYVWPKDAAPPAIAPFNANQAKKYQQAWAKYLGLPVEKEIVLGKDKAGKEVKLTMVLIPPGEFMMGSSKEENDKYLAGVKPDALSSIPSETPQHRVRITRPFYLGKHEVNQAQWEVVMERNQSWFKDSPDHPVAPVSWKGAQQFATKLNKSSPDKNVQFGIPTEAQWEYACRAGTTTYWNHGNNKDGLKQYAWFLGNSGWKTHPEGRLKPNAFGLYDMHGNVWEVCDDWYAPDYYAKAPVDDPQGPNEGKFRVARGGGWRNTELACRSASRMLQSQWAGMRSVGFRLAASINLPKKPKETADVKPFQWPKDAPAPAIAPFDAKQANQHQQAWAKYLGVPVEKDIVVGKGKDGKDVKLTLVLIPPGEFLMGSTKEEQGKFIPIAKAARDKPAVARIPYEGPQHRVRITRPFFLGKYEVTQAQWQAVMANNPSGRKESPLHPVERVRWGDIQPFLTKLNEIISADDIKFSLPGEAQWEYACRAGTTTFWHSGDQEQELFKYGWFKKNSGGKTQPVGQLKPNAFGLYDMHGNVFEWCADWFSQDYYANSPVNDPRGRGPETRSRPLVRGGGVAFYTLCGRSAHRCVDLLPNWPYGHTGFRLALSIDNLDRHRKAADYVLSLGGKIRYDAVMVWKSALPKGTFPLTGVILEHKKGVTDEGLAVFRGSAELEHLNLRWTGVTQAGLAHFSNCKKLTSLALGPRVPNEGLAHFRNCNGLTALNLTGGDITDAGMAHFKHCAKLEYLALNHTGVTAKGLAELGPLPQLENLDVGWTQISDDGLAQLQSYPQLKALNVGPGIGDRGLAHLKKLTGLTSLKLVGRKGEFTATGVANFRGCMNLQHLSLSWNAGSDAVMAEIKGWPALESIRLDEAWITDNGLSHLQECKTLKSLVIVRTKGKISRKAVEELRKALPDCSIRWDRDSKRSARGAMFIRGNWRIEGGVIEHPEKKRMAMILFGSPEFGDGNFTCEVMRAEGDHGLALVARATDLENYYYFDIGVFKNAWHSIYSKEKRTNWRRIAQKRCDPVPTDRWVKLRLKLNGDLFEAYVDGKLVLRGRDDRRLQGYIGLRTWNEAGKYRNLRFTDPAGKVLWEGLPEL